MRGNPIRKRLFTIYVVTSLSLSGIFGLMIVEFPSSCAHTVELIHDAGNLTFKVDNHGTLPFCMKYLGIQQSDGEGGFMDDTFFFFDQSGYYHFGEGDIATGRERPPGGGPPEFDSLISDVSFSMMEDGVVDKSYGSFTKVANINGQADDVRIFQTAWTKQREEWGIIQWNALNLQSIDLTEVRLGLKMYSCAGGDNWDDKAHWNPQENIFYIKDSGSSTYIGFASADPGNPINLYWDGANNNLSWDIDIYNAIKSSPYLSGFHNDLGCIVGWTDDLIENNGLTLPAKESITRALIIAGANSYVDLTKAIGRARDFYLPRTLAISEIADEITPQVEIKNMASTSQDLTYIRLSVDGGATYWSGGTWSINPIPPNGFSVWTLNGNDAFDGTEGDTLGLYDKSLGTQLDVVAFGQEGVAPDPIDHASFGSISRVNINDWVHSLEGMTFGQQNSNNTSIRREPEVILNEVMFNPTISEDGFIELMYIGSSSVDLNGFSIVTDGIMHITSSYILYPDDPYFIVFRDEAPDLFDSGHLSKTADNVYLYDNEGSLLDMVGWNSPHQVGKTVKRVPDGRGSYQGYDDLTSIAASWVFDSDQTIPFIQIAPVNQYKYGKPGNKIWHSLTITNKMDSPELIDVHSQYLPFWVIEFYESDMQTKLTDSDSDGAPDIIVDALSFYDISVKITIPQMELTGDYGNTIIIAQANSNFAIQSSAILQTRFYPYLLPEKSIAPSQINVIGTGFDEKATITLNVTGRGFGVEKTEPQDVVLIIDRSNSMLPGDIDFAKQIAIEYVENMNAQDRGAIIHFDTNVVLMSSLTNNHNRLKNDISNIPGPGELTYMGEALLKALQELNANGQGDHSHVIVLFTDGGWNGDLNPETVAYWARENRTFIFTVDLSGSQDSSLLKEIAEITGGVYFPVDSIEEFRAIYDDLVTILDKMAGYDPFPTDSNPLIRDVLPPGFQYVPGSFSITPDHIHVDDAGYTILEWNLSSLFIGDTWIVNFEIKSNTPGYQEANNYTSSRIDYFNWEDVHISRLFPKTMITVNTPDPEPPLLFIEANDNQGKANGRGESVRLLWQKPKAQNIAYYLIYRSESQVGFDFSSPWIRTDIDYDNGIIPKRKTWNDTYVSKPGDNNYKQQLYYIVRAVDTEGKISTTSRTVGKWTKQFQDGLNTFSLPLEPLQTRDTEYYSTDMRAGYIKWMDSNHKWVRHDSGECEKDNTNVVVGDGYEVMFTFPTTYTFCGMPAAMIRYDDFSFGFDSTPPNSNVLSLAATVDSYETITLTWERPANMNPEDIFQVLRSCTRDGFWGYLGVDYKNIMNLSYDTLIYKDLQVATPDSEFYYMIVPVNLHSGEIGISSYSIGVWTARHDSGYDTFSIPLTISSYNSVDWYCDEIQNVVGINHFSNDYKIWIWHSKRMPKGVYDIDVVMGEGYQISTNSATKYSFIGI